LGTATKESTLRFEILGAVRAWHADQEIDLGPGKRRAVLAVLLIGAGEPVPTSRIIDAVWGEEPPLNGPNVVQKHISGLRGVLAQDQSRRGPGHVLPLTDAGYLLRVEPGSLDLAVFQAQLTEARTRRATGQLSDAAAALRGGLSLWRGPALAGLSSVYFDAERERLAELRANALEVAVEIELELGRHAGLVSELIRLVAEYPLREGLRALLMLALYRSGRPAEALDVFRQARRYLADELGIEPGDRLQQLHRQVLAADPVIAGAAGNHRPTAVAALVASAPPAGSPRLGPAVTAPHAPAARPDPAWGTHANGTAAQVAAPFTTHPFTAHPFATHPPATGPVRPPLRIRLATLAVMVLVPLASFGFLTWAVMAYAAVRLRSWALACAAAGYFGLVGIAIFIGQDPDALTRYAAITTSVVLLTQIWGAVHGQLLRGRLHRLHTMSADPVIALAMHRRALRQQAIQVLSRDPRLARDLRIGRPDLPHQFDDGGLVDINAVPEPVLAALPGVTPHQARQIVQVRLQVGAFATVDDLILRGLLPKPVVNALRDTLIALQ
jgi:DNA-binding SARP family transcriptional activator